MPKPYTFLIITLLCCLSFPSLAQEEPTNMRYFNMEAGVSFPKYLDEAISSLRYQGPAFTGSAGFLLRNQKRIEQLDFFFDAGFLDNKANGASMTEYNSTLNYGYQRHIKTLSPNFLPGELQWYVGGTFSGIYLFLDHSSYSNNAFNNSVYLSLNPSTTFLYDFDLWNRKFTAHASAFFPILTFALRPAYGSPKFEGYLDDSDEKPVASFFESGQLVTLNKFFRLNTLYTLEYHLKNNNALRIRYMWDFYTFNETSRSVKAGSHTITIGTMFSF